MAKAPLISEAQDSITAATRERLVGEQLLAAVRQLQEMGANQDQVLDATGYSTIDEEQKTRRYSQAFFSALAEAQGFSFKSVRQPGSKPGRQPSYQASVQPNGSSVVGKVYWAELGANPGDRFSISVDEDKRTLTLQLI